MGPTTKRGGGKFPLLCCGLDYFFVTYTCTCRKKSNLYLFSPFFMCYGFPWFCGFRSLSRIIFTGIRIPFWIWYSAIHIIVRHKSLCLETLHFIMSVEGGGGVERPELERVTDNNNYLQACDVKRGFVRLNRKNLIRIRFRTNFSKLDTNPSRTKFLKTGSGSDLI